MRPLSRPEYLRIGVSLMALKYLGDATIVFAGVGVFWTPLDYIFSLLFSLPPALNSAPTWVLLLMGAWALPFIAIGVRMTMRRAIDAGWSPWLALAFFVPIVNYILMFALSVVPGGVPRAAESPEASGEPREARAPLGAFLTAVAAGALVGVLTATFGVYTVRSYGGVLFLAAPYVMGVVSAFVIGRRSVLATRGNALRASVTAIGVVGLALAATAFEGLVCLVMASPLALVLNLFGATTGWALMQRSSGAGPIGLGLLMLPMAVLVEPSATPPPAVREVLTIVEIAAPPSKVWPVVIAFPPMDEPGDLLSRAGIAYPMSARIDGSGVGAIRYCEFSTGAFVEPITAWEQDRRLAFDVTASPPPMREWSPYGAISAPHLTGFLRSRRGEFRLVPLENGGTRLEGRTWYEVDMGPQWYWQLWSDWIIHRIHRRVLDHIRQQVE